MSDTEDENANKIENVIVLITKVDCPDCKRFEKEWNLFQKIYYPKLIELLHESLMEIDEMPKVKKIIFDPESKNAAEKRQYILDNYADQDKDGYPLLLFYVSSSLWKRWKPYWFDHQIFRTAHNLFYSSLLIYRFKYCFNFGSNSDYNSNFDHREDGESQNKRKCELIKLELNKWPENKINIQTCLNRENFPRDRDNQNSKYFPEVMNILKFKES